MTKIKYTGIADKVTPKPIMGGPREWMTGMMRRNSVKSAAAIATGIINHAYKLKNKTKTNMKIQHAVEILCFILTL